MRFFGIICCVFALILSASAQQFDRSKKEALVKQFAPPNGIYLYDSIFIDQTEISNIAWLEYLHYIVKDSSEAFYISQLPDTTCWETYLPLKDSIDTDLYESLRYPGYRYFPVVGITYEQAANYSRWRGDIVTAGMKEKTEKDYPALGQFEVSVVFRLPTKEEWEFAAAGGLNLQTAPYGLQRPWKGKRRFESGLKRPAPECLDRNNMPQSRKSPARRMEFNVLEDFYFDDGNIISCHNGKPQDIGYIYDYPPNPYSLYNMIGNVAELTSTKGVAKGGSFEHKLSDCAIEKDFPYDGPHEWLGFRCIAEVHFKKR